MKISNLFFFVLCFVLVTAGCSSDDSNEDEVIIPAKNAYDYYVDAKMQKSIDELGITIHKGANPPFVEGVYTINPFYCANSNFADSAQGTNFGIATLTLSKQNTAQLSIDFKNYLIYNTSKNEIWQGKGSFISGQDNKFSILLHSNGEIEFPGYTSKFQNLIILSGELDIQQNKIKGIKNVEMASIMSDDYGDKYERLIAIGQGRYFTNDYANSN